MTSSPVRSSVSIFEIVRHLPGFVSSPWRFRRTPSLVKQPNSRASIGLLFEQTAARRPDGLFLSYEDERFTYREANERVNRFAHALANRGVTSGDVVGILATNEPDTLFVTLAVVKLGAVAGMLNHHQRGGVLDHSIGLLGARILVAGDDTDDALESLDEALPEGVILHMDRLRESAESASITNPVSTRAVRAGQTAFYIFTSGTTGLPKASSMSHLRWLKGLVGFAVFGLRMKQDDVLYCCLPLYHNNALTVALSSAIGSGGALALSRGFSVSHFWEEVRAHRATGFIYIGELCRYLLNRPARPDDRDNSLRMAVGNGMRPEMWTEFSARFGVDRIVEFYGASECNIAFINMFDIDRSAGFCPYRFVVVEYDEETGEPVRGEDGHMRRVPRGDVGLLLAKINRFAPYDGYTDDAASEKKVFSDAFGSGDRWFDSGDLVRRLGMRHVAFVDRLGDTFRWKGENVATTEVEGAITADPQISEAVVFGVEIPDTDGKAGMAAITLREGEGFDGRALADGVYRQLPGYALPLFVRVVDSLEHTSTFKSKKVELRTQGYRTDVPGELFVLDGREKGFVPFHPDYPARVAAGDLPGV